MTRSSPHVLLVPGFAGGQTLLRPCRDELRTRGVPAENWSRAPFVYRRPIDWHGARLADDIEKLANQRGQLIGFGWSEGGHVWISAMQRLSERFYNPQDLVGRVITFGTPFDGTWAAYPGLALDLVLRTNIREMRPGSRLLKAQLAFLRQPRKWDFQAIGGTRDLLARGRQKGLDPAWCHLGPFDHKAPLYDPRFFDLIHRLIIMP